MTRKSSQRAPTPPHEQRSLNKSLNTAKTTKQDDFYTQLPDIEKELKHYTVHFKDKTVLCNCDDPKISNFFHYFSRKFHDLNLKRVITTCYRNADPSLFSQNTSAHGAKLIYEGERTPGGRVPTADKIGIHLLKGDGDFRSPECTALLKEADIVVTNPPFSLFREYVSQLVEYKKKFIVIGNMNAITYKEVFSLIKTNRMWLGHTHPIAFVVPNHYEMRSVRSWRDENGTNWRSLGNACWFTNLDIAKRHERLVTFRAYDPISYPEYDNYNAIEVSRYRDIPGDFSGIMGVPVTFLEHYNPEQFEIIGSDYEVKQGELPQLIKRGWSGKVDRGYVNGKRLFGRILIQKRMPSEN